MLQVAPAQFQIETLQIPISSAADILGNLNNIDPTFFAQIRNKNFNFIAQLSPAIPSPRQDTLMIGPIKFPTTEETKVLV